MKEIVVILSKIQDEITEIKETQIKNTADIAHHIKRSDLAEERMDKQDERIKPLEKMSSFVKGAIWALGIAGGVLFGLQQMGILNKLF